MSSQMKTAREALAYVDTAIGAATIVNAKECKLTVERAETVASALRQAVATPVPEALANSDRQLIDQARQSIANCWTAKGWLAEESLQGGYEVWTMDQTGKHRIVLARGMTPNTAALMCFVSTALPQLCDLAERLSTPVPDTVNAGLLEALKNLMSSLGGGPKACGHDFECICPGEQARAAVAAAEAASAPVQTSEVAGEAVRAALIQRAHDLRGQLDRAQDGGYTIEKTKYLCGQAVTVLSALTTALSSQDHSPGGLGSVGGVSREERESLARSIDDQLYDHKKRARFDAHDDDDWAVTLTAREWRRLEAALCSPIPHPQAGAPSRAAIAALYDEHHGLVAPGAADAASWGIGACAGWDAAIKRVLALTPPPEADDSLSERGRKLVPREPDKAMISAATARCDDGTQGSMYHTIWRAMWDAAPPSVTPTPPSEGGDAKLPHDVEIGHITYRKGVSLRTLIDAATRWNKQAGEAMDFKYPTDAALERAWRAFLRQWGSGPVFCEEEEERAAAAARAFLSSLKDPTEPKAPAQNEEGEA